MWEICLSIDTKNKKLFSSCLLIATKQLYHLPLSHGAVLMSYDLEETFCVNFSQAVGFTDLAHFESLPITLPNKSDTVPVLSNIHWPILKIKLSGYMYSFQSTKLLHSCNTNQTRLKFLPMLSCVGCQFTDSFSQDCAVMLAPDELPCPMCKAWSSCARQFCVSLYVSSATFPIICHNYTLL